MFDYYEDYNYELSTDELAILASEWKSFDEFEQGFYDGFEDFCVAYINAICYGDGD